MRRLAIWVTHAGRFLAREVAELLAVSTQAIWKWVGEYNALLLAASKELLTIFEVDPATFDGHSPVLFNGIHPEDVETVRFIPLAEEGEPRIRLAPNGPPTGPFAAQEWGFVL